MKGFDTFLVVDWSAAKGVRRAERDAIWIGATRDGVMADPVHMPTRRAAESWLAETLATEIAAGRRVMAAFDFPFGYPEGFAQVVTGRSDALAVWDWLEARIEDDDAGRNNRFDVASELNAMFGGTGPFWGKPKPGDYPEIPYRGSDRRGHGMAEKRACDVASGASSSVWQLFFNPTVGSQALMGLPMLARLRRMAGVAAWPFDPWQEAPAVLTEIWPGLIEPAVKAAGEGIRDAHQVRLLSAALARLPAAELAGWMDVDAPEEGWILGADQRARLTELAMSQVEAPRPPPLRNDCFALPAGVAWTPVDEALGLLRDRLSCVTGVQEVPLMQAAGRVLARDLVARRANPPLPNTAVDGYGFAGGRGEGPHDLHLVEGRAAAGARFEGMVPDGCAIRVLTGAALPDGVDTVVLQEDVETGGGRIAFHGPIRTGANTRKAGEDVDAGDTVLHAGRVLTPADLALASITGHGDLGVRQRLRVGVLSTGDEVVPPGSDAGPGGIFDANRPMLLALLARWGMVATDLGHVGDDRAALKERLESAVPDVDAILTSGGASAGDEDHVSALLQAEGAMQSWRIALKPGRPLALGMWRGVPVFGLPGNPVAAFVCTLIFGRPALRVLAGAAWQEPEGFEVPAGFSKRKKPGRREYLRARLRDGRAEVFRSEGSGRVSGLSWAEGLVELPEPEARISPGDPVRFLPFGSFGL